MRSGITWMCAMAVIAIFAVCVTAQAEEKEMGKTWFVGVDGNVANPGAQESPWDIASALGGKHDEVQPGDTIALLAGTYKIDRKLTHAAVVIKLVGTEEKPIHIKPYEGARVAIDGGIHMEAPAAHVWVWDLEIFATEWLGKIASKQKGSWPDDVPNAHGGVHCLGGKNCKYINLAVHNTQQGFSVWTPEIDCEIYGCLIYNNGWDAPDRTHGHCIYTQNKDGVKTFSNNIMSTLSSEGGQSAIQAYGSGDGAQSYTNNYSVTDNIAYNGGKFLIGGGRPSGGLRIYRNYLYGVPMWIGYYWSHHNDDCDTRDNYVANENLHYFNFTKIERSGNTVINGNTMIYKTQKDITTEKGSPAPTEAKVVLLPSKYSPNRAHMAIYNWAKADKIGVSFGDYAKAGDKFRLMNPKDFYGEPLFSGVVDADGKCGIPVKGEFSVFVVIKE